MLPIHLLVPMQGVTVVAFFATGGMYASEKLLTNKDEQTGQ